jgi:flagellar motor switch protein FliM
MSDSILSSGELDALRAAVESDHVPDAPAEDEGPLRGGGEGLARLRFGEARIGTRAGEERLSWVFDRSLRALERRLADALQQSCQANVTFLKVTRWSEFRETFEVDVRELAALSFRIAGLLGEGLLVIEPEVVERIIEGLMGGGGDGRGRRVQRSLSELDLRVAGRVLEGYLEDLAAAWNPAEPLPIHFAGADASGAVARAWLDATEVVAALVEMTAGKRTLGMVGVVMPRSAMEHLARPGAGEGGGDAAARAGQTAAGARSGPMRELLPDFAVQADVVVGRRRITVRELLALQAGDVLVLDGKGDAELRLQGVPKLRGMPGRSSGRKAICIQGPLGREGEP